MTDTRVLLGKILALRQRLEQTQRLFGSAASKASAAEKSNVADLTARIEAGARQQELLDTELRPLSHAEPVLDDAALPPQLTARAGRLLRRAQELLSQLRAVANNSSMPSEDHDPLRHAHREAVSMSETVVRTVHAFPPAPSAQMRLCEGLEAVVQVVAERLAVLQATLRERRREADLRHSLVEILQALADGCRVECKTLEVIAESIRDDARNGLALRFPEIPLREAAEHIAGHSIAVAHVIARMTRDDTRWRDRPLEPITAALITTLA
jgi:hypothetical protein